ncbi:hypothetical protein, partial [Sphingobium sp. D43FB]|uniref:hypothetical protein n=1 Tax=Sphingobium sp. D43FB TaxID=2017595 RepID=UPI001C3EEC0A
KPRCVRCSDLDLNTRSHAASSHANDNMGILQMDSFVPINPLAVETAHNIAVGEGDGTHPIKVARQFSDGAAHITIAHHCAD